MAALSRSPELKSLQGLCLGATTWTAGAMASISMLAIPAMLKLQPAASVDFFTVMYKLGRWTQPPATLCTGLLGIYVTRKLYLLETANNSGAAIESKESNGTRIPTWKLFAVTAGSISAVLPYTLTFMETTSHAIMTSSGQDLPRVGALVVRWGVLNMIRAGFATVGAAVGFYAELRDN